MRPPERKYLASGAKFFWADAAPPTASQKPKMVNRGGNPRGSLTSVGSYFAAAEVVPDKAA